jgi:magnesium chelatase family protein
VRRAGGRENRSMTLALVHSRALRGLEAPAVTVEVHLANGLPSFALVGLADTEVKESRDRVRAALQTSGLEFPHNKRVTLSLAPADLPKESGRFDLPIALGILAAAGQLDPARLDAFEFAGELSLGGRLQPVHGALAMALALQRSRRRRRARSSCRRRARTSRRSSKACQCAAPIICSTSFVPFCPAPPPTRRRCTRRGRWRVPRPRSATT